MSQKGLGRILGVYWVSSWGLWRSPWPSWVDLVGFGWVLGVGPGVWGEVLGWVLAGSVGFGGRLGSSLEGSGVGFEGSWGAFGAIPKRYYIVHISTRWYSIISNSTTWSNSKTKTV